MKIQIRITKEMFVEKEVVDESHITRIRQPHTIKSMDKNRRSCAIFLDYTSDAVIQFDGPLEARAFAEKILELFPVAKASRV